MLFIDISSLSISITWYCYTMVKLKSTELVNCKNQDISKEITKQLVWFFSYELYFRFMKSS